MKNLTISKQQPQSIFDNFNVIDTFMDEMFGSSNKGVKANIATTDSGYEISIEAPGLQKDDFKISVDSGTLTISSTVEKKVNKIYHREFYQKTFSRAWTLPPNVKLEDIQANYERGILVVSVPCSVKKQENPITINIT